MISDQFFHPSLWFLLLTLMAVSLPLYVFVLWKSWQGAIFFLFLIFLLGIYAAFFSVHNFGGAFGPGMILSCLAVFMVPISIILWILLRHPFKRKFPNDPLRKKLYLGGGLLIVISQTFPLVGSFSIDAVCFRATQTNAKPLIAAIEDYVQENGDFPVSVEALQPTYLTEISVPGCRWLSKQGAWPPTRFELYTCNDGTFLLITESVDNTSIERYNFDTGNWSAISFLDGACSHLR